MERIIELSLGGFLPQVQDALGPIPNIFQIKTLIVNGRQGLTVDGEITLQKAVSFLYDLINAQPAETKQRYIRSWIVNLNAQILDILEFPLGEVFQKWVPNPGSPVITIIDPTFTYWVVYLENGVLVPRVRETIGWPIYMVAESSNFVSNRNIESRNVTLSTSQGSGFVKLTPEFNIPTTFDNANFVRAQDDNYTDHIREFINSPQYDLALHVRPKIYEKCSKKKCCKCRKRFLEKKESQKYTSAPSLQSLVQSIYLLTRRIQTKEITFEEGKKMIDEKVGIFEQYSDEGASTYTIVEKNDNVYVYLCKRYHLQNTDCIVGFTMKGVSDFITNRPEPEFRQVIMTASSVPIDEDMSDAIYPSNTGIFIYKDM